MLEHTLARARSVTCESRIITVIGRGHRRFIERDLPGRVIEQPEARGTAVGVFWPLSLILREDPGGVVLILPSDHFFHPVEEVVAQISEAGQLARDHQHKIVLLGALPDSPETDYGWIEPQVKGGSVDRGFAVASFHEKPSPEDARLWFERGYYWNTMITAAATQTLWSLGKQVLPDVLGILEAVFRERTDEHDVDAKMNLYAHMPTRDFSRDFLSHVAANTFVLPLERVLWSDWGRPERLFQSLGKVRREHPDWVVSEAFSNLESAWSSWISREAQTP
jgi:mannose-1-phosphate guanylyltransferase